MYEGIVGGRPYYEYKKRWLGKRVDVDKAYGYQCVDLFKHYMKNVLGINIKKSGNANEIWNNKYKCFDKKRTRIIGVGDLMQGDIIISIKGKYGHIAIFDHMEKGKIYVLEQNGSGSPAVEGTNGDEIRIQPYSPSFWAGVRRGIKIMQNYAQEISRANSVMGEQTAKNYKETIRKYK